ncbi:HK97 gp10 family phage protein [Micrococcus antarcticus]|uniref:HK97 gp10 family phage protein n=1 Tax=Micrococcus antarcticus TaxID=86171 RepID=UPI00384F4BCC
MKVRVDNAGIAALLARADVREAATRPVAERVLAAAQSIAPVDTGAYRDSLRVETTDRGSAVVAGTDHAVYVEADHGTLARALGLTTKG